MKFEDFLNNTYLHLPKKRDAEEPFNSYIEKLIDRYVDESKDVEFPEGTDKSQVTFRLEAITVGIKDAVKLFYFGKPFDAYTTLKTGIDSSQIKEFWEDYSFDPNKNFYRIRIKNANYPLSRQELFHIPFNLRGKIRTQRFSIPGFPCLYLSNSIYTAWEEMKRPNLEEIQAIRLQNKSTLNLIDLTNSKYGGNYNSERSDELKIYDFLMWPLIAACSIKVREVSDHFKPEYIIPQLLLQWIRNNKSVHGIKFSSTHIDLNESKSQGNFYNLVLPVIANKENGYCENLSEMFKLTDVLSWQLHQFSSGEASFSYYDEELAGINSDIINIEIIKGRVLPYHFSPLSNIEMTLKSMKAMDIDFT